MNPSPSPFDTFVVQGSHSDTVHDFPVPVFPPNPSTSPRPTHGPSASWTESSLASWIPPATTSVWGLDFACLTMDQTIESIEGLIRRRMACQVITANLNYIMLCEQEPRLMEVTRRSPLKLCDGMPIYWRSRCTERPLPERVAGSDLIFRLCERASLRSYRVFFLGASEGVAQAAADRLKERYPGLHVAGVLCPPFRVWSEDEVSAMCKTVRDAQTDLLFVAFGQPKGELWIEDHLDQLGHAVCIQLGASFDFVAGNSVRAPKWMQKLGLEWLHRSLKDPRRLVPRYLKNLYCLMKKIRQDLLQATQS